MAYAAIETWDVEPEFNFEVGVRRRSVRTPIEGGMVQRRQTFSSEGTHGQAGVRTFQLQFKTATKADYNRVLNIWKDTKGGAEGVSFTLRTPYTGSTETVIARMLAAPLMLRQVAARVYSFTVTLEEMLHAP